MITTPMSPSVRSVVPQPNFTLLVSFDSGETGILNVQPFLNFGVFSKLKDPAVFQKVHVAFDTIEWDCGVDLDPEFVYSHCVKSQQLSA